MVTPAYLLSSTLKLIRGFCGGFCCGRVSISMYLVSISQAAPMGAKISGLYMTLCHEPERKKGQYSNGWRPSGLWAQ